MNGPTLVPLLTLGIPGDNVTTILLGAFVARGLRPGPQLFEDQGAIVFGILIAMVLANLMFVVIGYLSIPLISRIVTVETGLLVPMLIMFAFAGAVVFRSDPTDLPMLVFFRLFGLMARAAKFHVMPMVMGFILGGPIFSADRWNMPSSRLSPWRELTRLASCLPSGLVCWRYPSQRRSSAFCS